MTTRPPELHLNHIFCDSSIKSRLPCEMQICHDVNKTFVQ